MVTKNEAWKTRITDEPDDKEAEYFEELDEGEDDSDEMQRTRIRHRLLRGVKEDIHKDEEAQSWRRALAQQYPGRYRRNGD